jgi:endonuclease YncB( thermonuclease family)
MKFRRGRTFAISVWLTLVVATAQAANITGQAISIVDGDSIIILDGERTQHRIRILGIDAPSMAQPFGERSRDNMMSMVAGKPVTAHCFTIADRETPLCKVWVQPASCPQCGMTLDVGHAQIIAGLARWSQQHAREQTLEDRGRYESSEQEARLRKLGLWQDNRPGVTGKQHF